MGSKLSTSYTIQRNMNFVGLHNQGSYQMILIQNERTFFTLYIYIYIYIYVRLLLGGVNTVI